MRHHDLDLLFGRSGTDYQARIQKSLAGEGQLVSFPPPFTDREMEDFLIQIGRPRAGERVPLQRDPSVVAEEFGGRLFDTVFAGAVGACLRRSLDKAADQEAVLRIRLRLAECPQLSALPWELLYDTVAGRFLALSARTPLMRFTQLPVEPRPVPVKLPLRLLVIKSQPLDLPALRLDREWQAVSAELRPLVEAGLITVTELRVASLTELRRALLAGPFHVLYYLGHGAFSERSGGTMLFTDGSGEGKPEPAEKLDILLHDHPSLRLAILNACETGRSDPVSRFAGVAEALVRSQIPAVIAMQFEFSDRAAIKFAPALLGALAGGLPIDAAVAEARKEIYASSRLHWAIPEWATPVLYLRASDAHLFNLGSQGRAKAALRRLAASSSAQALAYLTNGDSLARQRHFADAEAQYREAIAIDPHLAAAHAGLAEALDRQDRHGAAEAACREAIRLDPRDARAYAVLGHALNNTERYAESEAACREAVRLDPANAYARNGLGNVMRDLERHTEAEAEYREAIRLDPALVFAHNGLGNVLADLGRYDEAEAAYREAIRLDPELAFTRCNLGNVLSDLARFPEAEAAYREAIRLDPGYATAHNNLGTVLWDQGRIAEAEAAYRTATRLDPRSESFKKNLSQLLRRQD